MAIAKSELFQRLSFIKYLYIQGIEQAEKSEPICNSAVLTIHDAIELFLQLVCEHLDINANKADFMTYFELIEKKTSISQIESMRRFNKTRVSLKHNGTMASKADINFFANASKIFFIDNCKSILDIDFDNVSLVDLVTYPKTKSHLLASQEKLDKGESEEALEEITIAFWEMIEDYEETKKEWYGKSPFFFGNSMTFLSSFSIKPDDRKLGQFIDKVSESIKSMQTAMKILSLGLDYKKFARFDGLTPIYIRTIGGHQIQYFAKLKITNEQIKWCFDYVIESCVILQNFDYCSNQELA